MKNRNMNQYFKMAKRAVKKHSPEILTGLGIAGMITTTVLAVKATPKALALIEEEKYMRDESGRVKLEPVEIVKVAWKPYIPAVLLGCASASCLIGANSVHSRRHAALYSAYKLSETALSEYKDKVAELVPEKKVKEIKQKLAEDKVEKVIERESEPVRNKSNVIVASDGDVWFIDPFTNGTFLSSTSKIDAAINRINKQMMSDMFVSLSDLYDELGLDHTNCSDYIGWCIDDGLIESSCTEATLKNGKAYIIMDFLRRPEYGFDDKSKYYA
jgi:hypothetical protein